MLNNKPKYIYWIQHSKGGIGEWFSLKEAKARLKSWQAMSSIKDWRIVKKEPAQCRCGAWTDKEDIDAFGECLRCDKLRGDMMIEAREMAENYN